MQYFDIFTYLLFMGFLGVYFITNLQWYNYKIKRVILNHHKPFWHLSFFVAPLILFYALELVFFGAYFYILYIPTFYLWYKKLDKKVVLTSRVKRFFGIFAFSTLVFLALCLANESCTKFGVILPLALAHIVSLILEKIFFLAFKDRAKKRLQSFKDLTIVAITASYGKTSIKNYLHQVLQTKFRAYKTPRSVNTIGGILKDVNDDLPLDTEVYIAEAGAREKGDIEEIALFLNPQISVIGSVGRQHIEYFKTLDNIIHTKMEILKSHRLTKGFVHESVPILDYPNITKFPKNLKVTKSNLDGIWFEFEIDGELQSFHAPLLGAFNAINLSAVILVALELKMSLDEIKKALEKLTQVDHRLKLMRANGKVILDDSFNGNLEGMLEAVKLCADYEGRKIIVTPGIVESTDEENKIFAKAVGEVFDMIIITGSLNQKVLTENLVGKNVMTLKNKAQMQNMLAEKSQSGDLILFANDAPNFI